MFKKLSALVLLCFLANSLFSQETSPSLELKVYTQAWLQSSRVSGEAGGNTVLDSSLYLTLGGFAPALTINRRNHRYHEFSVVDFRWDLHQRIRLETPLSGGQLPALTEGEDQSSLRIALQYEYGTDLFPSTQRWKFYFGVGILPYFQQRRTLPRISSEFRSGESRIGARLHTIGRIQWRSKGRFFLDMNLLTTWADLAYTQNRTDDPSLPLQEQRLQNLEYRWFPLVFGARFGLGFKI
jgi:hypothetical protein